MPKCTKCLCELTDSNWPLWNKKKRYYSCRECINKLATSYDRYKKERKTNRTWSHAPNFIGRKATQIFSDCKRRFRNIELTHHEVVALLMQPCHYCGHNSIEGNINGLDRVNSSIGYTKDNVVPCCKYCNFGKNALSEQEYIAHCRKVLEWRKDK